MRSAAIIGIVVVFLAAGSFAAMAQQGPAGGPGGGPGMRGQEVTPEQFPELKARVLKMLDERQVKLEEHRACVEKAQSHEEMRKCRPESPMGGGPMHRGPGQQRPPQTGGQQQ